MQERKVKTWEPHEIQYLKKVCSQSSASLEEMTAHLGRSYSSVKKKCIRLGIFGKHITCKAAHLNIPNEAEQRDYGDVSELSSKHPDINSPEDLLKYFNVDTRVWSIEKQKVNKWDMGYVTDGFAKSKPLFQIKVWLRKRPGAELGVEVFNDMINEIHEGGYSYKEITYKDKPEYKTPRLLEIAIPDLHFGKFAWEGETGDNYNLEIAENLFLEAIQYFIREFSHVRLDKILLPIGNDFFTSDNMHKTTTRGTPQDEVGHWKQIYIRARRLLVKGIDMLQQLAPVDVMCVQGNHDVERSFYLCDALDAWYHNCKNVTVINNAAYRKYYSYGKCLIGFTHGNEERTNSLPMIMAQEVPELWAKSKYRELHLGHFHKKKEYKFVGVDEENGVRIRILPSLSGTDSWHHKKGYNSQRSAEAFLWHPEKGVVTTSCFML